MVSQEPNTFILCVHLSTGEKKEHIYTLPDNWVESFHETLDLLTRISNAFRTTKAWFLPLDYRFLQLDYPSTIYNPSHISYIEYMYRGPKEWVELASKSIKKPIGFKPNKNL